ncbi:hypothetical protein CRG98_041399 [Punica granatum]|uniref:Uncharacterized protein n=1 Tax=Punica granatum TaxID=22663 RepID=A0A2I0I300_PUNGR|nr:hypothetical protein CRG98_041399 [Punica granatum]
MKNRQKKGSIVAVGVDQSSVYTINPSDYTRAKFGGLIARKHRIGWSGISRQNGRKETGDVGRRQFDLRRTGRRQRSNNRGQDLLPLRLSGSYQERLLVVAWLPDELGAEGSDRRKKIRVFDSREEDGRSDRRNGRAAAWGRSGPELVRWAAGPSGAETRGRPRDKDKFKPRSRRCMFVGYSYGKNGWRVYDLERNEIFVTRDVRFYEREFPFLQMVDAGKEDTGQIHFFIDAEKDVHQIRSQGESRFRVSAEREGENGLTNPLGPIGNEREESDELEHVILADGMTDVPLTEEVEVAEQTLRRSDRVRSVPKYLKDFEVRIHTALHAPSPAHLLHRNPQASRNWCAKLAESMQHYGFRQSGADHSLFVFNRGDIFLAALVYVDDILVVGNNHEQCTCFKRYLDKCFCIKDLGPVRYFLGIEFMQKPRQEHWDAAMRVLRYLKQSPGQGIFLRPRCSGFEEIFPWWLRGLLTLASI